VTRISKRIRFGLFEFDEDLLELSRQGRVISLRPQALKLLGVLLARPGELVSRDDLQRALWGDDTFVDFDQGLNHAVREIRAALGDTAESPRFVQTLPRRGYRFIAPVERVVPPGVTPAPAAEPLVPPKPDPRQSRVSGGHWRLWATGAVALVIGIVITAVALRTEGTPRPYASLAVRPFSSPADPALGPGLADAISDRLGGQHSVSIRGSERGATHVLDGSITTAGSAIIVEPRLREVVTGTIVWSQRIAVQADRLFSVEDVIAEQVVSSLRLRLAAAEQERLRRRYTENSAAYVDYLRGRAELAKYTLEGTRNAIGAFEAARRRDPDYVLARAGLAMAAADMYLRFSPSNEVDRWGERAEEEVRATLALDSDLAEAHLARAAVARKREFDWQETVSAGRRALQLNPNLEQAHFFVAAAYYHHGYMEEALIEVEKGRRIHGVDEIEPIRIEALVALFSGSFAPARALLEEVSRLSSQPIGDTYLALAYYYSGSAERAQVMLEALSNHRSASTAARASAALAGVLAATGRSNEARSQIARVLAGTYRDHHVAYSLGAAYAQLGETDEADRWLRTAVDTGFPCPPFFERDPLLEPLRRRAQFADLLAYVRARRDVSLSGTHR
jgi:DNA-binding winged helix-turn-helix (wHTH) protein/tetratricopeptide (TPR) repeat protein